MRKKNTLLIISVFISGLFVSCLDNFTERTSNSANIVSFRFEAQDTCPGIENYAFNIDQTGDTGLIYNLDSLPFGSHVNYLCPTLTLQTSNGNIYIGDSLFSEGDSLNFTSPVIFKNTSSNGLYTRIYKICVNVHHVNPDSMILNEKSSIFPTDASMNKMILPDDNNKESFRNYFASSGGGMKAYLSNDGGLSWTSQNVAGIAEHVNLYSLCKFNSRYYIASSDTYQLFSSGDGLVWDKVKDGDNNIVHTKIVTLFGQIKRRYLTEKDSIYLVGLADSLGITYPAKSADGVNWTIGSSAIDSEFPFSEYALTKGATVTGVEFYTIATGLKADGNFCSSVWSTENGLDWFLIKDGSVIKNTIGERKGASLFYYNDSLVCFGGVDPNGKYHNELYISKDNGLDWKLAPNSWQFVDDRMTEGLAYSNVYVEHQPGPIYNNEENKDSEFIWIFGGRKASGIISPYIWSAHLNKMVFKRW